MIGRTLRNRYEVRQVLGEGSTATVYLAQDLRLGRPVALKVLLPHVKDAVRTRFFQEGRAAAALAHPNIMAIYDIDEQGGQPFLVVEYVQGAPLSAYIPSSAALAVALITQIARALHAAHEHGIIHRDVKPANIMVTPGLQVKIMDLGLALPREAERVTAPGLVIGTPAYLSPEQAQGLVLDRRTDLYSLGVVLYEMVTGVLPFNAEDIGALLLQQVRQAPPPPRSINPDLPSALEAVILRMLEKQPARRFATAATLADALEASLPPVDAPARRATDTAPAAAATPRPRRTVRVLLADDHNVLRRALALHLQASDAVLVVGEAADGDAALRLTVELLPDVLVLDMNMPGLGGLEVLERVRAEAPSVKVLVLTGREEDWYIVQALRAGASGYLLKRGEEHELLDGIQRVIAGQLVLGQGVAEKMVEGMIGQRSPAAEAVLGEAERQILLYVAAGYDNEAIARRLNMSLPTLIETLARTLDKLAAPDRHAAALVALRAGLISLDTLHTL